MQVSDLSGRESSLWPGGEGEGPVQGSLLEEVLAEKRMVCPRDMGEGGGGGMMVRWRGGEWRREEMVAVDGGRGTSTGQSTGGGTGREENGMS